MGDFSQNGIVSTLHDFGTKSTSEIEKDLLNFSKERKMELILPCLYSELEGSAEPSNSEYKQGSINSIFLSFEKFNRSFSISLVDFVPKSCSVETIPF